MRVLHGDSAVVADGTGTYASRSAVSAAARPSWRRVLLKEKVTRSPRISSRRPSETSKCRRPSSRHRHRPLVTFQEIAKAVYSEMGRCRPTGARN